MRAPDYVEGRTIEGFWKGENYLLTHPAPMYSLTWKFIWSLIRLKMNSSRAFKFKVMISDYGYDS